MPLAYAPFGWWPVAMVSIAILFAVWLTADQATSIRSAFVFALAMFATGVSWVFVSLNIYGEMPLALAVLCVSLFVTALALYLPVAAWLQAKVNWTPAARLLIAMPVCLTLVEFVRSRLFTGFSWLEPGYSQTDTWLAGWASVLGIHGVTLFTAVCAGALVLIATGHVKSRLFALMVIVVAVVPARLNQSIDWSEPIGEPVVAGMVQLNIPLSTKWSLTESRQVAEQYFSYSQAVASRVDFLMWPESALPLFVDQLGSGFRERINDLGKPLLSGFLERRPVARGFEYYNAAVLFKQDVGKQDVELYRKQHLVPFGEYTPLLWLFAPIAAFFNVPMSDMYAWQGDQALLEIAGHKVGIGVCYEDSFAYDVRKTLPDARYFINISEDAWFGDSLAPHQRLQMARLRSRENARPMLRVSNTGLSAAIDHHGKIQAVTPQFTEQVLVTAVQPRQGLTPYSRFGEFGVWSVMILMSMAGWLIARRNSD